MSLTLEKIIFDERCFGLPGTPVQRAICRAADGRALGDLAEDPDVVNAFGGAEAVAALPVGAPPRRVDLFAGIRTAKSLIATGAAIAMSQRVDVSQLRPGEIPRVGVVSLDLDKAHVIEEHLIGTVMARPALRSLVIGDPTSDSIMLRHPSGCAIEVKILAGKRAGGSLVARWLAGLVLDEAPRMLPAAEGFEINIEGLINAAEGRILNGGQMWLVGTPDVPWGESFESVKDHFGLPTSDRIVIKTPAWTMNPVWWSPTRCEAMKRNPRAYRSDVLAEFLSGASAALPADQILRAYQPRKERIAAVEQGAIVVDAAAYGRCKMAFAAIQLTWPHVDIRDSYVYEKWFDPSRGFVIDRRLNDDYGNPLTNPNWDPQPQGVWRVLAIGSFDREERQAIGSAAAMDQIVEIGRRQLQTPHPLIIGDQFSDWSLAGLAHERGARFVGVNISMATKRRGIQWVSTMLEEDRLFIESTPGGMAMQRELLGLTEVPRAGGGSSFGGRTTDFASVLITHGVYQVLGKYEPAGQLPDRGPGDYSNGAH